MGYLYALINQDNNKKFLGKSNLDKNTLRRMVYSALKKENHYNKLLQKEFKENTFKIEFYETKNVIKEFDRIIKNEDLLNPKYGYNVFNDLQNRKGRHKKRELYTEDICILYLFNRNVQFWVYALNLERNTISNRLGNFGLFDDGYYNQNIARYEDYYWTALRILYLENKCLTAYQLMDSMANRYNISPQLRITPRKISKFFTGHGVYKKDKKNKGSLVFCPNSDYHDDDRR